MTSRNRLVYARLIGGVLSMPLALFAQAAIAAPSVIKCDMQRSFRFNSYDQPEMHDSEPWIVQFDQETGDLKLRAYSITGARDLVAPFDVEITDKRISFCMFGGGCSGSLGRVKIDRYSGHFELVFKYSDGLITYENTGTCEPYTDPQKRF